MLKPKHLGNSHTNHLQAAHGQTMYTELTLQPASPLILTANYWLALHSITGFHPGASLTLVISFGLPSDTIALLIALGARALVNLLLCGCILFGVNKLKIRIGKCDIKESFTVHRELMTRRVG